MNTNPFKFTDVTKVHLRFEGEVNFNWTIYLKDGSERHFYSIDQESPIQTEGEDEWKVEDIETIDWLWNLTTLPPRTPEHDANGYGDEWDLTFETPTFVKFDDLTDWEE